MHKKTNFMMSEELKHRINMDVLSANSIINVDNFYVDNDKIILEFSFSEDMKISKEYSLGDFNFNGRQYIFHNKVNFKLGKVVSNQSVKNKICTIFIDTDTFWSELIDE